MTTGASAHNWAFNGEPLRNSTSGSQHRFLDCPHCGDVILDVVSVRSGTLDIPRNTYSPLGFAWYAVCPECGWTSRDGTDAWTLLGLVEEERKKVRSEP